MAFPEKSVIDFSWLRSLCFTTSKEKDVWTNLPAWEANSKIYSYTCTPCGNFINIWLKRTVPANSYSLKSMGRFQVGFFLKNLQISHLSQHLLWKSLYGLKVYDWILSQIIFHINFAKNGSKFNLFFYHIVLVNQNRSVVSNDCLFINNFWLSWLKLILLL